MTGEGSDGTASIGGRVGGRIADYVIRANVSSKERLAPHVARVGGMILEDFFRLTGNEVKSTVGPLWEQIGDHPDAPQWLRQTGQFVGRGSGQWQTLLAGTATGAAMGSGILALITNEMTPVVGGLIRLNPNIRLSPSEAAAAEARDLSWGPPMSREAEEQGINGDRFEVMRQLNTVTLGPVEILELLRRGNIDAGKAARYLRRAGMDGDHARELLHLTRAHISLPDASAMINRSIIDTDQLHTIAAINGYNTQDADRYAELGGEPPAPELLYTAYRRGVINADRLRRGITQGPIRNEWFDVIEAMQYHSMTPEGAAAAVTSGHMGLARGQQIAEEYGLKPDDFAILVETAGRPPGVDFASEAWLRGFISDSEYDSMFLESAIKNKYLPVLRAMRTRLIPQETARSLLAKGVIDRATCATILRQHGFSPVDVESLIAASTQDRTAATRDLSLAATRELYAEQEITADEAKAMLTALGYDDIEAQWELDLADLARVRTYRNAVISRVRAGYVKGLIDVDEASMVLDSLRVPAARRDSLVDIWKIERETVTRDLTPAQIVSAAKKQLIDPTTALSRLIGQGYADTDARTLLALSGVNL